ncbi:MAG: penicillin-binding protein [Rickettsiales bacterium]|nr:MAG: penicillin-binding protein [Rickettsiales bacterium]
MKKYYSLFIAIILNVSLSYADSVLRKNVNDATSEYLSTHFMNGVYMFCDENGLITQGAKGFYSLENKKKLSTSQLMPIASATKTMTAASIMKLRDKGLLNMKDTVAKHLSAESGIWKEGKLADWASKITLHNLLTHRSGLPEYFMKVKVDLTKTHDEINKDILHFLASNELKFKPEAKYQYSNSNYVLLGLIIEQVSGQKLSEFMQQEIFTPLDMKDTKIPTLSEALEHQTTPESTIYPSRYFVTPTGKKPMFNKAMSKYPMMPFSDGGVTSTTKDMTKWLKALHSGKVVSADSYKLMKTRHYEIKHRTGVKNYMGYGMYIAELKNGDIAYHHPGNAVAIRSESGYIPAKNLYFTVLSNVMDYIPPQMKGKIDKTKSVNQLDIRYFMQCIFNTI